jgi:hypothetical protein
MVKEITRMVLHGPFALLHKVGWRSHREDAY